VISIRDNKILTVFGKKIKELRKQQKISQAQLAFEANIPREQVGRIERGQVNTTISSVVAIAKALKTHPKELFDIDFDFELDY
jgi:transcriptional regulator with XRE-family HTH domain